MYYEVLKHINSLVLNGSFDKLNEYIKTFKNEEEQDLMMRATYLSRHELKDWNGLFDNYKKSNKYFKFGFLKDELPW